ncbi:MAG: hypothetical protein WCG08_16070 [Paludibacter sp.]
MKRLVILLFSYYFLMAAIVLPQSNFALLTNLSKIYADFVSVNGKTSFVNFLDEQFIESFEIFDYDNCSEGQKEKEQKPVPINCYMAQQSSAFKIQIFEMVFSEPAKVLKHIVFYQDLYFFSTPVFIFHPPQQVA